MSEHDKFPTVKSAAEARIARAEQLAITAEKVLRQARRDLEKAVTDAESAAITYGRLLLKLELQLAKKGKSQ